MLLVGTRIALWPGVQLLLAGLLVVAGATAAGQALNDAAAWWMVYAAPIDLGTLGVIGWLLRRGGGTYRRLLGPPTAAWQVALVALGVGSVLPFLATWTALYYALGRRLLPIMVARWVFNGGTALALALGLVG